jgi:hypothetical protein
MAKLYNLARMTTATTGTGTITLGSAVSGFLTFALAGVANGETVSYGIKDGANSEVGTGTYTSAGTTLTRSVTKSTNSDSAISLSGSAEVYITARKEDILNAADPLTSTQVAAQSDQETGTSTTLAVTPGRQHFHKSAAKAWGVFDGSGTVTDTQSYGLTSITDNGTGDYTVNLSVTFSGAVNAVMVTSDEGGAGSSIVTQNPTQGAGYATTSSRIEVAAASSTLDRTNIDTDHVAWAIYGDF